MADPVLFNNGYVGFATSTAAAYAELSGNKSVSLSISRAELANSAMGDTAETFYPGLFSAPITIVHRQDFTTATTGVDKKTWAVFSAGNRCRIKLRAVDTAVSASNPSYILGGGYITSVTPINGSHGELLANEIKFVLASGFAPSRSSST